MPYTVTFSKDTGVEAQRVLDLMLKISALEDAKVQLDNERAEAEAEWRRKENFIMNEIGKLQMELRSLRTATIIETK